MPAYGEFERQLKRAQVFWISALLLLFLLVVGSKALAGTLVNADAAISAGKVTSLSESNHNPGENGVSVAVAPELVLPASPIERPVTWTRGRILKEVGKQAIDQPGHFLIGAAPIWASRYLIGVPWLGWVAAPVIGYREWLQWPSNRWWDPPLDWAFFTLGAVAATWSRQPGHGFARGLAVIRQGMASAFTVRGRMHPAG